MHDSSSRGIPADRNGVGVSYLANAGFSGTDTFRYTVADGRGGTATASVTVIVSRPVETMAVTLAEFRTGTRPGGRSRAPSARSTAAGAFGACLRSLPGTALSISPPGAPVAVTVSATYP